MVELKPANMDAQKYKLFCPLCSQRMEPLVVDSTVDEQAREETIWWTCQGVRTKTCDFPLSMPPEVFWTTRNAQQIESDVVPFPNFHLLPTKFHHLYSAFYTPNQPSQSRTASTTLSRGAIKREAVPGCFPQRPSKVIRSSPIVTSRKPSEQISDERCLELVDSHIRYLPNVNVLSMRMGKECRPPPQKPAESNPIEWNDMDLNQNAPNGSSSEQNSVNLPSCSSASSNSLEQNLLPEGHSLCVKSLGDTELDNLFRENLSGVLRSKQLKKRKKKLKVKPRTEQFTSPPPDFVPGSEHHDDFGFDFGINPLF